MSDSTFNHFFRRLGAIVIGWFVAGSAWAAGSPLRIAADSVPHAEILAYAQKLAPDLKIDIIEIPNGVNPNELLAHGDVDANYFQHVPYLHSQERALGQRFAVVASVHIEPLGVYSHRYKSYAQVPRGYGFDPEQCNESEPRVVPASGAGTHQDSTRDHG
jgi:ABC-type metal ion transport system substrate-binding protein